MRLRDLFAAVFALSLTACPADADPEYEGTDVEGSTTGGVAQGSSGGVEATTDDRPDDPDSDAASSSGEGPEGTGEGSEGTGDDDDDAGTSGGTEGTGGDDEGETDPPAEGSLEVLNVQSVASAMNGDSLNLTEYTAPADGILVVRGGAAGPAVRTVTFGGEALELLASDDQPDYWFAISADVYWMPVVAGQTGDIAWQYDPGDWTTRRRAFIAATVSGASEVHAISMHTEGLGTNEGRTGPTVAELELTTETPTVIMTALTSNGWGGSTLLGPNHTVDAFPTIPLEEFHSTRVYGGHMPAAPGTYTPGYENEEEIGWFDYILIVAAFSA